MSKQGTECDTSPQISTNPFPTMSVHGGGTGWRIRLIDVNLFYSKKPPIPGELHFKLTELTSERFEFKDDADMYLRTLELLRFTPGAYLVYGDVIKHVFTRVHEEVFQGG